GLALRFARADFSVIVGSRSAHRGAEAARELGERLGTDARIEGMENGMAASVADIVFLTVPYAGIADTVATIGGPCRGKTIVRTIAPLEWRDGRMHAIRPSAGSAAQQVQEAMPDALVTSAFQIVDAHQLQDLDVQ